MSPTTTSKDGQRIEWAHVVASGAQAKDFLQGQLTQDLNGLDEQPRWSLVLAPDSVVIASCLVARQGGDIVLSVERSMANALCERLARFLLRSDCQLSLVEVETGPFVDEGERVRANWPGPAEFATRLTPHSFGTTFVQSTVSFTKGCFTGQELVGRLDARGSSVPWRFVRASGPSHERVDAVLTSKGPSGPQGLTTVLALGGGVNGVGFAHRSLFGAPGESVHADDVLVTAID